MMIWSVLRGKYIIGIMISFFILTLYIRAASSSLSDLEVKLNKAIERNVILGKYMHTTGLMIIIPN